MNAPAKLHNLGQSLWLDNITRDLLTSGTLAGFIANSSVTGLTSNPTIFDKAISGSGDYDDATAAATGGDAEAVFFNLAIADLQQAAALFRAIHDATNGTDGWVSLEVSPRLAYDTSSTVAEAKSLHQRADTPNLFIKVPGTAEGLPAIEELIFSGIPVNVTLLFSPDQYRAAAAAYQRGLERRIDAGLEPRVGSVASLFISRWDVAVAGELDGDLSDRLGVSIAQQTYAAYRDLLETDRWAKLAAAGAAPQRLLFASTGTKDPALSDTFYIGELAAPDTVNTMPEPTLVAFTDHGEVGDPLPTNSENADATIARIRDAGIDVDALGAKLQTDGAASFVASWTDLLSCVESKTAHIAKR